MAKGGYFYDSGGVARKLKKGYFYDSTGVARKIKKAYRFDASGVARPCWSGGELAYYGTVTALGSGARNHAAATAGDTRAVFAGGVYSSSSTTSPTTTSYDKSLTQMTKSVTGAKLYGDGTAAASIGDYAIFTVGAYAKAFNSNFAYQNVTSISYNPVSHAGTTVGNYAVFWGGNWYGETHAIWGYNSSLTMTRGGTAANRYHISATTIGDYALFAGGRKGYIVYDEETGEEYQESNATNTVTVFNGSLTYVTYKTLGNATHKNAATTVGNYALIGGGFNIYGQGLGEVYAFNSSLTKTTAPSLSVARGSVAATTLGEYAIFAGGESAADTTDSTVDIYDASLTRTTGTSLTYGRWGLAGVTIGNYALFGGGLASGSNACAYVEAYTIA